MGSGAPPRRRDRRLGAPDAGRLPLLGPHRGRLRAGARRRARGRRAALRGLAAGHSRRRADPAFRAALAAQPGLPRAPRPARAAPPQHHAAAVLRGLGRRAGANLPDRARGARAARAALRPRPGGQRVQPARARGARRRPHRRAADLSRLRPLSRAREPGAAAHARRRRLEPAVRGAPRAQQAAGRPDPAGELLAALPVAGRAAGAGRQAARGADPTSTRCRRSRTRRASRRPR